MLLKHGSDPDLVLRHDMAEDRHRRLIVLCGLSFAEKLFRFFFGSRYQVYAEALLWTYAEAIELMNEMAALCADDKALALVERF